MATSPDGSTVFVGATVRDADEIFRWVVAAYPKGSDGFQWNRSFADGEVSDVSIAIHPSNDGSRLIVVGKSYDWDDDLGKPISEWVVRALDPSDGRVLWTAREPMSISDIPHTALVPGEGDRPEMLIVGGLVPEGRAFGFRAVNAEDGTARWSARHDDPKSDRILFGDMVVAPESNKVFVTGYAQRFEAERLLVLAFDAGLDELAPGGRLLWSNQVERGQGVDIAVTPDERRVVVAARLYHSTTTFVGPIPSNLGAVAYDADSGERGWIVQHPGFARVRWGATGSAVAVDPTGKLAFVTGVVPGDAPGDTDFLTYGIDLATGATPVVERFATRLMDVPTAVLPSADGRSVYIAGTSAPVRGSDELICFRVDDMAMGCQHPTAFPEPPTSDIVLVRYDVATTGPRWIARYNEGDAGQQFGDVYALTGTPEGDLLVGGRVGVRGYLADPAAGLGADDMRKPIILRYAP